jgi:Rrf2 family cysteine metabolism transcriptional repressor
MKLSKRSEYGLRALLDLAISECDTPVSLKELADRNNLPFKFMEHIFLTLRNAGIVLSHAGARGGYTLGRPPEEIFLGEVIRTLDGTIAPVSCTSKIAYEPCTCPDESTCLLRPVMHQVRDAIANVVDNTSLADITSRAKTVHDG